MKTCCKLLLVLIVITFCCAAAFAQDALSVRATGPRPSLMFTDKERLDVKVQVKGGSGNIDVGFTVRDSYGTWQKKGSIKINRTDSSIVEKPLPIKLPGRGHYLLDISAKCGSQTAVQNTTIAMIYAPLPSDQDSPWGIFWIPNVAPGSDEAKAPAQLAENIRLMGASWVRFNFWESVYKAEVKDGKVILDLTGMKKQAAEFRKAGLHIFGEFVMTPKALASSTDESPSGDAGPLYSRLKPRDFQLWEQLVEQITREFKDDISVWEIWNEADIPMAYWSGTPDEFVEVAKHTSMAIKRANPKAKVVGAGFTSVSLTNPDHKARTQRMFDLGIGKYFDIISIHYSDADPGVFKLWKDFLARYGLSSLPMLNSEEISAIPLENLRNGMRNFKFIHIDVGYPALAPLLNPDWSPSPSAVSYSTGARILGSKKFIRAEEKNNFTIYYFGTKDPVAAIRQNNSNSKINRLSDLSDAFEYISITAKPSSTKPVEFVDIFGRGKKLANGKGTIPFQPVSGRTGEYHKAAVKEPLIFITNCSNIESIKGVTKTKKTFDVVAEAEDGKYSKGWSVADSQGWSGGKFLNIWVENAPDSDGYYAELTMEVPESGEYEVYFSGNSLSRLVPPASVSPFVWRFDKGPEQRADRALPVIICSGAPEGLSTLGRVKLTSGKHTFYLRLLEPRKMYDSYYALWFDAIALLKIK